MLVPQPFAPVDHYQSLARLHLAAGPHLGLELCDCGPGAKHEPLIELVGKAHVDPQVLYLKLVAEVPIAQQHLAEGQRLVYHEDRHLVLDAALVQSQVDPALYQFESALRQHAHRLLWLGPDPPLRRLSPSLSAAS